MALILACIPMLILVLHPAILWDKYTEIVKACGGLVSACIIGTMLGLDQSFLEVNQKVPGNDNEWMITRYNTVPFLCTMFIVELIVVFIVNPSFIQTNFTFATTILGSIVGAWIVFALFGGDYRLIHTFEYVKKDKKRK